MIRRAPTAVVTAVLCLFLLIPLVALLSEAHLRRLPDLLGDRAVRDAIWVTAKTNFAANVLILAIGTPAAWLLATRRFKGRGLLITLTELPLFLPPAVAGVALLAAYARGGLFGEALERAGIILPFGPWAVIIAITFVALPYYLRQAIAAFGAVDPEAIAVARTLGASRGRAFRTVALPLAAGGLTAGWVLAFGRGIGEFGATIIFAGNVQGRTSTLTLTVYQQLETRLDVALALGVLMLAISAVVLILYKLVSARCTWT